ncbi:MAG TPA: AtpZ/AtpI family protein [Caldithrix abyssi]|uniref:AtpZ/AtpI family protein n=1 Tax=Caldithrix abyssi TaxID=187145 RepID=A0A7V4U305_CALAY|nr:AtpZ/AtpI family protein [Caldithrix abyssi]
MASKKNISKSEINNAFRKAGPYLNIGYTLLGGILVFGYLGNWLDEKAGTEPLFMITGLFAGLALGFYNMIKVINQITRR